MRIKINTENLWFTSDTHYHHTNICRGITNWRDKNGEIPLAFVRDFENLEEMNKSIVDGINNSVAEDDFLVHLGDWSFGGFDKIEEFRSLINCKNVILVLGNHDHHIENNRKDIRKIFKNVSHYVEIDYAWLDFSKKIVACHYPIVSWNNMGQGSFMLHGHQHLKDNIRFGNGKRMDVGLCGSPEFRPYHISEINSLLSDRKLEEWPPSHHNEEVADSLNPYNL